MLPGRARREAMRFRRRRKELLGVIHFQAKTYGLPPHLLARCSWEEFRFNQEVLEAGLALERMGRREPGKTKNLRRFKS